MKPVVLEPVWAELRGLVSCEDSLTASLIHLSVTAEDPREAVWLRKAARDCHGHARTLRRHLEPGWAPSNPNFGEGREDVLAWARDVSRALARNFLWCADQPVEEYTRMLLTCMSGYHDRLAGDLEELARGELSFPGDVDFTPVLEFLRSSRRGRRIPECTTVRRGA